MQKDIRQGSAPNEVGLAARLASGGLASSDRSVRRRRLPSSALAKAASHTTCAQKVKPPTLTVLRGME